MKNMKNKYASVKNTMVKAMALFVLFCGINISAYANTPAKSDFNQALATLQHEWVDANYEKDKKTKKAEFLALQDKSLALTIAYPNQADAWIWDGIIQSSYAGFKGGLRALSYANGAKDSLEKAITINASALDGSAHTSLGVLYSKVPGWPISFGDDDEAEKHLKIALEMNPNGIDVNYFLAEFYADEGEYAKAKEYLITANAAPARLNREDADKFRHIEIDTLLTQVNKKLKG